MESNKTETSKEVIQELNEYLINIKTTIYKLLFGPHAIKKPINSLVFGYFIGFLTNKFKQKFSEEKIGELIEIFKKESKKGKDIDEILALLSNKMTLQMFDVKNDEENYFILRPENEEETVLINCPLCQRMFNSISLKNYFLDCGCIIHNECFDEHIKTSILKREVNPRCPLCEKDSITENLIQNSLNINKQEGFLKLYKDLKENPQLVNSIGEKVMCNNEKCKKFGYVDNSQKLKYSCLFCNQTFCLNCKEYWHIGYTCEEFKEKQKIIESSVIQFEDYIKTTNIVKCPTCKRYVVSDCGIIILCECGSKLCTICKTLCTIKDLHHPNYNDHKEDN